jgi:hypothetical protein
VKTYRDHPFSEIFPLGDVAGREWEEFKESVGERQMEPILLFEGKILDGRRRYRACVELGKEPLVTPFYGGHRDALDTSFRKNMHRRSLSKGQRGMALVAYKKALSELADHIMQEAGKRGGRGNKKNPVLNLAQGFREPPSRDKAAEAAGVSPATMQFAANVHDRGVPELQALVKAGEVAVSAAAEVAKLPPGEQAEVVAAGPDAVKERAARERRAKKKAPDQPDYRAAVEDALNSLIVRASADAEGVVVEVDGRKYRVRVEPVE